MKFKIVGDSCCDLSKEQLNKGYFFSVPLTLTIGDRTFIDDQNIDVKKFLEEMEASSECPKSACPSPEAFMEQFDDAENIYVVTLSAKLSGSYNSAVLARQIYLEDHPDVNIHVFDSKSAAAAQRLICEKLEEFCLEGLSFSQVVKQVDEYIQNQKTLFVLENLDVMRKNGRLSAVKAMVANVLNIKPVLYGVDGEIHQLDQARGVNKALNRLLWHIQKEDYDINRKVVISQCESYERCMNIKKILVEKFGFKKVEVIPPGGLSTMYMSRGGVVLSF